jgi:DNA-binding SARP family transcriptional activator
MASISEHPVDSGFDWRTVGHLLEAGHYEQVIDLLDLSSQAAERAPHPLIASSVAAVQQICLACRQCHLDVEWHRQAGEAAIQHEDQLRNHAQTLITRLYEWEMVGSQVAGLPDETREAALEHLSEPTTWWQRMLWWFRQPVSWIRRLRALLALDRSASSQSPDVVTGEQADQDVEQTTYAPLEPPVPPSASMVEPTIPMDSPGPPLAAAELPTLPDVSESRPTPVPPTDVAPSGAASAVSGQDSPTLTVYCLGPFRVYQDEQPVEDWQSSKGLAIFKYLVTHRERPVAKEILMELFWPEVAPDAARNNLNVAIYGLRRALRRGHLNFSHVLFRNDAYLLNPELHIWIDVEAFSQHLENGRRLEQLAEIEQAVGEYRLAEALYQGELFEEDRYEDWLLPQRQQLQDEYLALLDRLSDYHFERQAYDLCTVITHKLLGIDSCREEAQQRLMRCYSRQGQHHLALRQYHLCVEALARELDVGPSQATQELYEKIQRRQPV